MALPSFVATGSLYEILGIVASSELVQSAATRAQITLMSNHPSDVALKWEGTLNWLKQPVIATVDSDGEILNEEGEPLRLLARHDDLIPNLQWRISVNLPPSVLPPLMGGVLRSWTFNAGEDGTTIDLSVVAPIARIDGVAWLRGRDGYSIDEIVMDSEGRMVAHREDGFVLSPTQISVSPAISAAYALTFFR